MLRDLIRRTPCVARTPDTVDGWLELRALTDPTLKKEIDDYRVTEEDIKMHLNDVIYLSNLTTSGPVVMQSQGKGYGLFAEKEYSEIEFVTQYGGREPKDVTLTGPYILHLSSVRIIDGFYGFSLKEKGRWVNEDRANPNIYLKRNMQTSVAISKGSEFLTDYGDEYSRPWERLREKWEKTRNRWPLKGLKKLGSGTFNVAILTPQRDVLRFADVDDTDIRKDIIRGAAITHLFQKYKRLLGPSLLIETRPGQLLSRDSNLIQRYRSELGEFTPDEYFVHGIEYLAGKTKPLPDTAPESIAFPLIWFLITTGTHFSFVHNDFKNSNVVFRNYDEPRSFIFELEPVGKFTIESRQIPVVIDFDFSSVLVTRPENRAGTNYTQPPEILQFMFLNELGENKRKQLWPHDDWWSLGMTLYYWWTGSWSSKIIPDFHEAAYMQEIRLEYDFEKDHWGDEAVKEMFRAFCIARQLNIPIVNPDPIFFSSAHLDEGAIDYNLENPINLDAFQYKLLRRLLSWNPSDRNYAGDHWRLITDHFQVDRNAGHPDYCAKTRGQSLQKEQKDMADNYDQLKMQICVHCGKIEINL